MNPAHLAQKQTELSEVGRTFPSPGEFIDVEDLKSTKIIDLFSSQLSATCQTYFFLSVFQWTELHF